MASYLIYAVLVSPLFCFIGYIMKEKGIILKIRQNEIIELIIVIFSLGELIFSAYYIYYTSDYRTGAFSNPIFTILNAVCGFLFLSFVSEHTLPNRTLINNFISFAGKHSLSILMWHMFGFQILLLIQMKEFHYSLTEINHWAHFVLTDRWKFLACFFGIMIPLLLSLLYESFMQRILHKTKSLILDHDWMNKSE